MPALKGQSTWSRKPKSNPYAERGLDQFALVSEELQAARDRLVAQLGTQLSLVRFTSGSDQNTWIPIIVASTSSKAEMRALRRAASDLVTGGKHAFNAGNFGHHTIPVASSFLKHLESSIGEYNTHKGFSVSEKTKAHDSNTQLGSRISEVGIESSQGDVGPNPISKHDNQIGISGYLMAARQGFLWMVNIIAFGLTIMADIASKAILPEQHTDGVTVGALPSSQAQPTSITGRDMKGRMAPHPLNVEASKIHTQSKELRFASTSPSSPRDAGQAKVLSASVSLPKTVCFHGHTLHGNMKEKTQAQKSSTTCMVEASASRNSAGKLGQALSGVGLVVILGGLAMGYIPAIASVVCWWYVLPSMRKAVGDKPLVRSHHRHHGSQELLQNEAGGHNNNTSSSVKIDMAYQEYKKKVIMDGLLERQRRHSNLGI